MSMLPAGAQCNAAGLKRDAEARLAAFSSMEADDLFAAIGCSSSGKSQDQCLIMAKRQHREFVHLALEVEVQCLESSCQTMHHNNGLIGARTASPHMNDMCSSQTFFNFCRAHLC